MELVEDPEAYVVFSAPSMNDAIYFLRSLVEEPALHLYSQVDVDVSRATLYCMSFVNRDVAQVVELSVDMSRLEAPPSTYAARFQCESTSLAENVDQVMIVHQLVARVQQCVWTVHLAAA